jgi:hypothetical protein
MFTGNSAESIKNDSYELKMLKRVKAIKGIYSN